jgi:hypothetical protein
MSAGPWSGCLSAQSAGDDFDNYALHRSPACSTLQYPETSAQSSPRSWDSPEQLGPTPWEAANQYHGLDPQLTGAAYLPSSRSSDVPTSYPVETASFVPAQGFGVPDDGAQQAEPYSAGYPASSSDGYATTPESSHPLSPSTTNLTVPSPQPPREARDRPRRELRAEGATQNGRRANPAADAANPASSAANTSDEKEEPYAKLIYRAFMSKPERAMTLQELYQWFRENTEKGKDDTKGWQNSIRHNLSMNGVGTSYRVAL